MNRFRGSAVPTARHQGAFTRFIVGTAMVAAAGVALPEVALAAPPQAAAAAEDPSNDIQRADAAALVGVTLDPDWLGQTERGFVAKIYYKADELDRNRPLEPMHQKKREAAIAALAIDGEEASSRFIKTGIHAAHAEDHRLITERNERRRAEYETKAKALTAISLPVNETVLAKSVYDFIVHIDLNAHTHNNMAVRAAARIALQGNAEAQWDFLRVGIHTEHRNDTNRLIQERADKTEAEKEELRKEAARLSVAGFAIQVDSAEAVRLSKMSNQQFVWAVWNAAPNGSEVYKSAEAAVRVFTEAAFTAFINEGAVAARLRDIRNHLARVDEERTRQIVELRTRADKSLVYPELVKAADAALAGTPDDRTEFLATGQYQHRTQTLRINAYNGVDSYVADHGGTPVIVPWRKDTTEEQKKQQQWKIEPGLSNPECFSFQSVSRPHNYLVRDTGRYRGAPDDARVPVNYGVDGKVAPTDGTSQFKIDATWCVRGNADAIVLRPVGNMEKYLTVTGADHDSFTNIPAKWDAEPPTPLLPMDRRYNSDANLRTSLGKPTGEAVLDANNLGYKPYEKGRLYLTSDMVNTGGSDYRRITVHVVYNGPVLDKFLAVGGPNAIQGELFDQVPTKDGKGQVIRIGRPGGGYYHIIWGPQTGAHVVYGAVGNTWAASGGEIGPYGYPVTDEITYSPGVVYSRFTGGTIQHSSSGIKEIKGEIHRKFAALGFEEGLGLAYGAEAPFGTEGARWQMFSGGSVIITPRNGTVALTGSIDRKYHNVGLAKLGYPLSDAQPTADGVGKVVNFSLGGAAIYQHPTTNASLVYGAIATKYRELGAERSFLGYPTSDETALPKGSRNTFQNGRIDASNDGGTTNAYQTTTVTHKAVEIKGVQSGRCIQTAGLIGQEALNNLAAMELWDCVAGVKQIWDVVSMGNNVYGLKNRHSGKCLDLRQGELHNLNPIVQYDCHFGSTQQWEFTTAANGTLALRSVHSAKVVEAYNPPDHGNATAVRQWADRGDPWQRWTLVPMN
ncbi:RICIN domain-containing protein [Kibdelosporangium aridum]|uniref:RICIN domain-containing protein n=1 Tax=Kibdelosporangium aridum TaxID=2030 RepID=UPI00135C10AD|nr:RICIN domain-containing protein [Kibdelosporangium aridum]